MKLLAVLEATTGHFSRNGLPSPRLQAELLLAHALNLPRLGLYLQFERDLANKASMEQAAGETLSNEETKLNLWVLLSYFFNKFV